VLGREKNTAERGGGDTFHGAGCGGSVPHRRGESNERKRGNRGLWNKKAGSAYSGLRKNAMKGLSLQEFNKTKEGLTCTGGKVVKLSDLKTGIGVSTPLGGFLRGRTPVGKN